MGLCCGQFAGSTEDSALNEEDITWGAIAQAEVNDAVEGALAAGVNFFDTAEVYPRPPTHAVRRTLTGHWVVPVGAGLWRGTGGAGARDGAEDAGDEAGGRGDREQVRQAPRPLGDVRPSSTPPHPTHPQTLVPEPVRGWPLTGSGARASERVALDWHPLTEKLDPL